MKYEDHSFQLTHIVRVTNIFVLSRGFLGKGASFASNDCGVVNNDNFQRFR